MITTIMANPMLIIIMISIIMIMLIMMMTTIIIIIIIVRCMVGAGIAQLVVLGLAVHSVAGSILLWGHFR